MKCTICDVDPAIMSWTDTHGIAQCMKCGVAYRIIDYPKDERGLTKGREVLDTPLCTVKDNWIDPLRKYVAETGRMIPSGYSFLGGQELCPHEDIKKFNEWAEKTTPSVGT